MIPLDPDLVARLYRQADAGRWQVSHAAFSDALARSAAKAFPAATPSPADIERLLQGELVSPPRLKNAAIPKVLNDAVMQAMAADVARRYQRASDLLRDLIDMRPQIRRPTPVRVPALEGVRAPRQTPPPPADGPSSPRARTPPQAAPGPRFCWNCRKPLHARTDRCPFCREPQ